MLIFYSAPTVSIPQGTVVGTTFFVSQTIEEFLGIPFAAPPTGANRYKPPVPAPTGSAVISANNYQSGCVQTGTGELGSDESEDCLYLNVFRTQGTTSGSNLPVAVYIHGGSFNGGGSNGRDMFRMVSYSSQPMIGVSINYRLGAFGFLSSKETQEGGALNLGMKDQVMALQWVQANIKAFGGDPTKVTIMGDSAGGHSVGHHVQSPWSKGLFSQAIMESGAASARFCQSPTSPIVQEQYEMFLEQAGIKSSSSADDIMAALRSSSLSAQKIKNAAGTVFNFYNPSLRWAFQPVIDGPGGVIPEAPTDIWTSGTWNKVPLLTGFCTDEGAPFVPYGMSTSTEFTNFFEVLNPELEPDDINALNALYSDPLTNASSIYKQTQEGPGAEYTRIVAAYGQFAYIAPVRQTAHCAAASRSDPPVYLYQFEGNNSVTEGTGHSCVGGYTTYDAGLIATSAAQKALSASVIEYWTSFITTGDPNGAKTNPAVSTSDKVKWPEYIPGSVTPNKMIFAQGNDERAGGKSAGIITQSGTDTSFLVESNYWWSHELTTEN